MEWDSFACPSRHVGSHIEAVTYRPRELLATCLGSRSSELDVFDQLAWVIRVCQNSQSLSNAGRTLFAISRTEKAKL